MDDQTLRIPWSRRRLWTGLAAALILVTCFAWAVLDTPTRPGESATQTLIFQTACLIMATWFSVYIPIHARRLLRHVPAVVLSADGIRSGNGILNPEFLPWNEVAAVDVLVQRRELTIRARTDYVNRTPTDGILFWRLLDRFISRGGPNDIQIPCPMLDIDVTTLANLIQDAHLQHRDDPTNWEALRDRVLNSNTLSHTRPGLFAEAASHGKGLSTGGCLTAIGMIVGICYAGATLLHDGWLRIPDCPDDGSPCTLMTGGDMLTNLFLCTLIVLPNLVLVYGKLFLPLTDEMVRDGKCHVRFGMPPGPTGRLLCFLNALGWIVLPGTIITLVVLAIKVPALFA